MKTHLTKLVNTGKQFTLFFVNGYQQLIFIHAVSTIDLG